MVAEVCQASSVFLMRKEPLSMTPELSKSMRWSIDHACFAMFDPLAHVLTSLMCSFLWVSKHQPVSPTLACEQAHLWVGYRWQRSWREEWGEEKWACTRAIDFWIPRVRWRTQRSDWLKLTDYRNQCKLTIFHITRTVGRLVQGAFLKLSINPDLSFELKLEQKIARKDNLSIWPVLRYKM